MAKMVGLSRNLKMQWLNKTAELVMEGFSEKKIHDQLNEYLSFEISKSSDIPVPKAVIIARISAFANILSNLDFSTFRIFPRSGRIACVALDLAVLALPPAESPSTI